MKFLSKCLWITITATSLTLFLSEPGYAKPPGGRPVAAFWSLAKDIMVTAVFNDPKEEGWDTIYITRELNGEKINTLIYKGEITGLTANDSFTGVKGREISINKSPNMITNGMYTKGVSFDLSHPLVGNPQRAIYITPEGTNYMLYPGPFKIGAWDVETRLAPKIEGGEFHIFTYSEGSSIETSAMQYVLFGVDNYFTIIPVEGKFGDIPKAAKCGDVLSGKPPLILDPALEISRMLEKKMRADAAVQKFRNLIRSMNTN